MKYSSDPGVSAGCTASSAWRKTEDEPVASGIDVLESEHVGQERAIGVRVAAEQDEMRAVDHPHRLPDPERVSERRSDDGHVAGTALTESSMTPRGVVLRGRRVA